MLNTNNFQPVQPVDWDTYWMLIARDVKRRSSCLTQQIGCVLVLDNVFTSSGYNGTVSGALNCNKGGCERCLRRTQGLLKSGEDADACRCAHAEQNSVAHAARHGIFTLGCTAYCWCPTPCGACARVLVNAGIKRIVCLKDKPYDLHGIEIFRSANIPITELDEAEILKSAS